MQQIFLGGDFRRWRIEKHGGAPVGTHAFQHKDRAGAGLEMRRQALAWRNHPFLRGSRQPDTHFCEDRGNQTPIFASEGSRQPGSRQPDTHFCERRIAATRIAATRRGNQTPIFARIAATRDRGNQTPIFARNRLNQTGIECRGGKVGVCLDNSRWFGKVRRGWRG